MRLVEDFINGVCNERNIHNYFAIISVSVLQAVENAVIHGNGNDARKRVTVSCGNCKGGLFFTVQDEGDGFDYQHYGTMPSEDSKGMGIFMMKQLCDNLFFLDGGRGVRMEYFIEGIDNGMAIERTACLRQFFSKVVVGA